MPNYIKLLLNHPTPAPKFNKPYHNVHWAQTTYLKHAHFTFLFGKSPTFLFTNQLPTKSLNTFKISLKKPQKPFGKWVRTLFEVPNLEYKGRLSVLYSSPETFRLSSCPRDQRARESTPLPPASPPGSQAWLKNLSHRAAELQRRPFASFVLDLGVERHRRHWLSSPSFSLILRICVRRHSQSRQPR